MSFDEKSFFDAFFDNGSFSPFKLEIKLENTSLDELLKNKEKSRGYPTLVHEYTHYLQLTTTTYGASLFYVFWNLLLYRNSNNALLKSPDLPPLSNGSVEQKLSPQNTSNFLKSSDLGLNYVGEKICFDVSNRSDFEIKVEKINDVYRNKGKKINSLTYISYKNEWIPISYRIIKENMAMVATVLAGKFEDRVNELLNRLGIEYKIIYFYLKDRFPCKDIMQLTYKICELLLLSIDPIESATSLFSKIENDKKRISSMREDEIISEVVALILPLGIHCTMSNAQKKIENVIEMHKKHENDVEFLQFLSVFYKIFIDGLEYRKKTISFYDKTKELRLLEDLSVVVKSPVLKFSDTGKKLYGNHDSEYYDKIAWVHGFMVVFFNAFSNKVGNCPFNENFSICTHLKGKECQSYLDILSNPSYEDCVMYNALKFMGICNDDMD
ncbi:MAG TPA: hypothetical protein PLZ43_13105 [bacterium]|nr:hypothetical protein [bacterium]